MQQSSGEPLNKSSVNSASAPAAAPAIGDIVEIASGYASFVNLEAELYDGDKNSGRMERYRPIASHRTAFETLAKSLLIKDNRCYLLTGSYGTGKSHLCLMFANYLQSLAAEPPMPAFFANYAEADIAAADVLQDRRSSGRYLVALCQWGGREEFEEVVLKAVESALQREGFGEDLDTPYLQALRKIEQWEAAPAGSAAAPIYDQFERELAEQSAGVTVNAFKKNLALFDREALLDFRRIHEKITTAPFAYDKSSLPDILKSTLASDKFKQRFNGLLVLYDEFGYAMEQGRLSPKSFQLFAELCANTPPNSATLIFIGTAHKSLTAYAKAYNTVDFRVASDRLKEVGLSTSGVEEIIGAIVAPQKGHPIWQQYVATRSDVFDGFGQACTRLKLFDWLKAPQVRTKIIENIYPMHPMATFALLRLTADVASNNRSVYTFFSGDDPASYSDFIRTAPILRGDKLNLYTADRLCDYFADTLKADNKELRDEVRKKIAGYENSLRALNQLANDAALTSIEYRDDPLVTRLLRLILIYDIIGTTSRRDNLEFGLYCETNAEKSELANRLEALAARNVLYFNKDSLAYELRQSTSVNLEPMIADYIKNPVNQPDNIVTVLDALVPMDKKDQYLEAKEYNQEYGEDKRLDRRFVRAIDLGTEQNTPTGKRDYFQMLEEEIATGQIKGGEYEGIALYVVCENPEDVDRAKTYCARNKSERIVVAIPKAPVPLFDAIMELRALKHIDAGEQKKTFSVQDNAALRDRINGVANGRKGAQGILTDLRNKMLNVREVTWHGKFAQPLPADELKPYDAANLVMQKLYTERNTFVDNDFHKLHVKVDRAKSPALKDAIEKLLGYTEPLVIKTDEPQQRGDIRYLQRCLMQNGILRQPKPSATTKIVCEMETDASKYALCFPALASMVGEISALGGGSGGSGNIRIADLMQRYRRPAYGQGPIGLALSLACLRRLFGDSIRFKMDESSLVDMPVKTFEDVLTLSEGQYPLAVLSYRPLTNAEREVVNLLYQIFGSPDSAVARDYTVVEAHEAIKAWWNRLPTIAKVTKLYAQSGPNTPNFLDVMERVSSRDAHAFVFADLPGAFGLDGGLALSPSAIDTIRAGVQEEKQRFDCALGGVEERITRGIRDLFGIAQDTDTDIQDGIRQWVGEWDSGQRDPFSKWHNSDSKPLVLHLKSFSDWRQAFFSAIPGCTEYGSRTVANWPTDKVSEYLNRLRSGKERIEANRMKVEPAQLEPIGQFEWPDNGEQIAFKDKLELRFITPAKGTRVYITEGIADLTNQSVPRREVDGTEPVVIIENKTIYYAAQDSEGNWSQVKSVQLTDANKEFTPAIDPQPDIFGKRGVKFKFPTDAATLKVTCRELFRQSVKLGIVDKAQMETAILAALDEAKAEQ